MSLLVLFLRLANALLVSSLVGLEREQRDRPAGLRTHLLVALASAAFMAISVTLASHWDGPAEGVTIQTDPARIASYVVAGMGFLGAGTIVRSGRSVHGITTAASLWLVTAVGLASGAGMYGLSWLAGCGGLLVLTSLRIVELRMDPYRGYPLRRSVRLSLAGTSDDEPVLQLIRDTGARIVREESRRLHGDARLQIELDVRFRDEPHVRQLWAELASAESVAEMSFGRPAPVPGD